MYKYYCGPMLMVCGNALLENVTRLSLFLLAFGVSFAVFASPSTINKIETSFDYHNKKYNALIYIPTKIQKNSSLPLIIVVPSTGDRLARIVRATNFSKLAGQAGFVVAFPRYDQHDSWIDWLERSNKNHNHAANYFRALIKQISSDVAISSDQIYLTGFSNGGMLALTAMCDMSSDIAAFAIVSAALPKSWQSRCQLKKPVPALFIASRDDPVIPWSGGQVPVNISGLKNISLLSTVGTVDAWRSINRCNARPLLNALENVDPGDRTTVTRMTYDLGCRNQASVLLYAIKGGGHSWPGSNVRLRSFQGAISQDFQAAETIWEFVRKYRLSQ